MMTLRLYPVLIVILALTCLGTLACDASIAAPVPTPPPLAGELILYNWADYMPQAVLDAFTAEYGVKVTYLLYDSTEEAVEKVQTGQVAFDVAVIEADSLPYLASAGLLAKIDYRNVPNFKNISANFRDLQFDPDNRYSVPYNYGTTGLIVRSDLVDTPVTRWADLWDDRYAGRILMHADQQLELISVALKSLGYPLNSEDPAHLEAALQRMVALKPGLTFAPAEEDEAVASLLTGEAAILIGWPEDALVAQAQNPAVTYVLPEEGTMLWGDAFVISANSPHKYTAELFLNFLLRPEIGAQITNELHYATANEAAYPLIDPAIRQNPIVFPAREDIERAEWYLPRSPAGQELYDRVWQRFMTGE